MKISLIFSSVYLALYPAIGCLQNENSFQVFNKLLPFHFARFWKRLSAKKFFYLILYFSAVPQFSSFPFPLNGSKPCRFYLFYNYSG